MKDTHRTAILSRTTGLSFVPLLAAMVLIALTAGCGSSSDTQTAVKTATSFDLAAQITSPPTDITVALGANIDFSGQGSGGSGTDTYTYSWNLPGTTQASSSGENVNAVFFTEGSHNITLTVTDNFGSVASDSVIVNVTGSTLSATITSPVGNISISEGDTINLSGQATGGTSDIYQYSWSIPGSDKPSVSGSAVADVLFKTAGFYDVVLTVTDGVNDIATDAVRITVTSKLVEPLSALITSPSSNITIQSRDSAVAAAAAAGATAFTVPTANFEAQATGGTGSYKYSWIFEGSTTATASTLSVTGVEFTSPGNYTITFTVTDSSGEIASDTVNVTAK